MSSPVYGPFRFVSESLSRQLLSIDLRDLISINRSTILCDMIRPFQRTNVKGSSTCLSVYESRPRNFVHPYLFVAKLSVVKKVSSGPPFSSHPTPLLQTSRLRQKGLEERKGDRAEDPILEVYVQGVDPVNTEFIARVGR